MVTALRELGHEVRVLSLVGEDTGVRSSQQARWKRVGELIPSALYEFAELAYNVVGKRRLLKAIREFRPDVIYDRYNSYSTAAISSGHRTRLPVVLEVNAPVAFERTEYEHLTLKLPWLARRYERQICTSADHVFVVSTPLKRYLVGERGVPPERVSVLPNGANPEAFNPAVSGNAVRHRYSLGNKLVIGFVGILRPWHGIELLMEAVSPLFSEWPALHLLIVGDGPIQAPLEELATRRGVRDRVTFTGRVGHHDVREHVAAMDVAVSPRATFYASPMKILEYMALARPVVAPDLENIRDIIEHGRTGMLFEPERLEALQDCIRTLLHRDDLRRSLGEQARRAVETRYNWHYNAREVVNTIERVTGRA